MARMLLALILLSPFPALAASVGQGVVVDFKDGSSVSGILVELTADTVGVKVGQARASWPRSAVSRILAKETDEELFRHLRSLAGSDPENLRRLAAFALGHGLFTDYNRLARRLGLPLEPEGPTPQEDLPAVPVRLPAEVDAPAPPPKPAAVANMFAAIASLSADPPPAPDPGVPPGELDPFAQNGRMILSPKQAQWYQERARREAQDSSGQDGTQAPAPTATLLPPGTSAPPPTTPPAPSPQSSPIMLQQRESDSAIPGPPSPPRH